MTVIGRKLGCSGERPCKNCMRFGQPCDYETNPRRRGPGKAPKGTRSKKRTTRARASKNSTSQPLAGAHPEASADGFHRKVLSPELRPQLNIELVGALSSNNRLTPAPHMPTSEPSMTLADATLSVDETSHELTITERTPRKRDRRSKQLQMQEDDEASEEH